MFGNGGISTHNATIYIKKCNVTQMNIYNLICRADSFILFKTVFQIIEEFS